MAVVLLGAPSVRDRTAPFVDFPNRVIDWRSLLAESQAWPPDQRLMVWALQHELVGLAFGPSAHREIVSRSA